VGVGLGLELGVVGALKEYKQEVGMEMVGVGVAVGVGVGVRVGMGVENVQHMRQSGG